MSRYEELTRRGMARLSCMNNGCNLSEQQQNELANQARLNSFVEEGKRFERSERNFERERLDRIKSMTPWD